jgi:predicted RNase H-like HicB family nuclease
MLMEKMKFVYYQQEDKWVGWLEEFPDYHTQGMTFDELKENLKDLYATLTSGEIPNVHRRGELVIK